MTRYLIPFTIGIILGIATILPGPTISIAAAPAPVPIAHLLA